MSFGVLEEAFDFWVGAIFRGWRGEGSEISFLPAGRVLRVQPAGPKITSRFTRLYHRVGRL